MTVITPRDSKNPGFRKGCFEDHNPFQLTRGICKIQFGTDAPLFILGIVPGFTLLPNLSATAQSVVSVRQSIFSPTV